MYQQKQKELLKQYEKQEKKLKGCASRVRLGSGKASWEDDRGQVGLALTPSLPPPAEVVADETPAVQAVLRADTKRLRLLEEERRLQGQLEQGDDTAAEKLEKVEEMAQGTQGRPCGSMDPWTCVLFSLLPGV